VLRRCSLHAAAPYSPAGKDATSDFEDIGHSDSAKEMMRQYCIGEIDVATIPANLTYAMPKEAGPEKATASSGSWTTLLQLTAPLLLLALAYLLRSFAKAKAE
jgi:cytochrome b5